MQLARYVLALVTGQQTAPLLVHELHLSCDMSGLAWPLKREYFPRNRLPDVTGDIGNETFSTGKRNKKGARTTVYNKTHRLRHGDRPWMRLIWERQGYREEDGPVIRVELQLYRSRLRKLGIDTEEDLWRAPAAWCHFMHQFRLRLPSPSRRRRIWPELPGWELVRGAFGESKGGPGLTNEVATIDREAKAHALELQDLGVLARVAAYRRVDYHQCLRQLPTRARTIEKERGKDYEATTRALVPKDSLSPPPPVPPPLSCNTLPPPVQPTREGAAAKVGGTSGPIGHGGT